MADERERKRRRKLPKPSTFLSTLSEEAVQNILRFVSARPRSAHWQGYVNPMDVLNILRSGGPLAEGVRQEFAVLRKSNFCNPACAMFVKKINTEIFKEIMVKLGPFEHKISDAMCTRRTRTGFFDLQELHLCSSLQLAGFDEAWLLEVCSTKLVALSLQGDVLGKDAIKAIERYCAGLQTMTLCFDSYEEPIRGVWATVGPTLQDLTFQVPTRNAQGVRTKRFDVRSMKKHCVSLTRLEIVRAATRDREDRTSRVVAICQAFGSQLRVLRMTRDRSCLCPDSLNAIFRTCTNVVVDAYVQRLPVLTLSVMGHRLRSLRIRYRDEAGFEQAGAGLVNLEEVCMLFVVSRDGQLISKFFSTPKPCLRKLKLDICIPLISPRTILDILAEHTENIEDIELTASTFYTNRDFRRFTEANQMLRRVTVLVMGIPAGNMGGETDAEEVAVGFMEDFAQCTKIEQVFIDNSCLNFRSEKIAEACFPLRGKNVDVFIGGVSYLT